jgi:hypothetical protein
VSVITEAQAAIACPITLRTYRRREAGLPYRGWHEGLGSFATTYNLSYDWLLAGKGAMHCEPDETPKAAVRPMLTLVSSKHPT